MNLSQRIPIWKVENHLLLSKTQSLSVCLELTMPEAYSLSKDQLIEQYNTFNRLIKALPKGYLLHKQDYYTEKYYLRSSDTLDEHSTFLAAAYERHFNERVYLSHKSYLFISKAPNAGNGGDAFTSNFLTTFITGRFIQKDIRDQVPEFENTVLKLMHILKSSKIPVQLLKQKQVTNLLNIYFNLGDSRILQDINLHQNHLQIGDKDVLIYNSVGSEIELPKELDVEAHADTFFDRSVTFPIGIGFKYPHIVNTIIRKNDPNNLIKLLSKKREKILSMTFKSRENQQLVDVYDTFLSDVIKTGETPVYVSQNIMLWGKDKQINKAENELNNALAKMDIYTQRNFNCANVFFGCCPGNAYDLPISEFQIQLSDAATLLFPIETNPKNTGINGIQISERDYGIPIIIDHWDLPMQNGQITNRNMFILGPSGSGKSFFTNFLTRQLVQQDYHITIIDVGGSYRRLCHHMGGKYFEYTANSKMQFNPFFVPKIKGEYLKKNLEEQESLKTLVFTLWKGESAVTTKEEETILARCITEYYELVQQENIKPMFDSFYEFVQNSFAPKLEATQRRYFDMDSFAMVLRPYYKGGEYDYLLNSPEEFSIADIPFCVFELDEIKDHSVIFPVVTLVIMEAFISKMRRHKKVRKMIFIEEAWSAISNEGMANFLKYLYKTVRKFNGAVGIITQEIEDILNNPFIRNAVINNADIQILLDQTKYITRFDELARALGLPQSEMKKILSINKMSRPNERYKDVYIRFGQTGKVYSTLVSPEEAVMFSTEASESIALDRLVEIEGDHKIAVMRMLEQKQQQKEQQKQLLKAKEVKKAS